jgi:hypothetical protein
MFIKLLELLRFNFFIPLELYVRNNHKLFKTFTSLFNIKNSLVNDNTDICVDGFPRSANSYTTYFVKVANKKLNVAHHTHSPINIKLALKKDVPMLILIRKPLPAISSLILKMETDKNLHFTLFIEYAFIRYKTYYNYVIKNHSNIIILNFEEFTKKPSLILKELDNLRLVKESLNAYILHKKALQLLREEEKKLDREHNSTSIPDKKRKQDKREIKRYLKKYYNKDLRSLNRLYDKVISLI